MYIKRLFCIFSTTAILLAFAFPARANLVLNVSFEDPVVDPLVGLSVEIPGATTGNWTQLPEGLDQNGDFYNDGIVLGLAWQAASGDQSRHLGANNEAGGVYQDITTQIGEQYLLAFSSSGIFGEGPDQTGYVSVGTTSTPGAYLDTSYTTPEGISLANMGWTTQQFTFTATDTTSRLTFASPGPFGPAGAITIDNVQVNVLVGLPLLTIDRDFGTMTLSNSLSPLQVVEYSIISDGGTVDPNNWTSVAGNYDANSGGSFDPDDNWNISSSTPFELTESQGGPTGDGGSLGVSPLVLSSTGGWVQSPDELLRMELVLFGGERMLVPVEFVGNGGVPFERSDLNFDGVIDPNDWPTFRDNNLTDLSGLSPAQQYGRGDLDGDGDNDVGDFRIFKADFEDAQGLGSFAAMIGTVPEPSSMLLLSIGGLLFVGTRCRCGKKLLRYFVVPAMVGVFACPAPAANLISNAGFESPAGFGVEPDGWTTDPAGPSFGAYPPSALGSSAHSGDQVLHPGDGGATGGRYQDLTTVVGETYDVNLWARTFIGLPPQSHVKVLVGNPGTDTYALENNDTEDVNTTLYSTTGLVDETVAVFGAWQNITFQFTALGTATRFGIYNSWDITDPVPPADPGHSIDVDDVFVDLAFSLLATVDTVTGNLTLENNGTNPIPAFDFYQIDSLGGALDKDGWFSLDEQNFQPTGTGVGETWDESGGSDAFHLAELYLAGNSTLDVGASVDLGSAFDPSVFGTGVDGDLSLFLSLAGGGTVQGTVQYVATSTPGDFDFDGDVDGSDFLVWQRGFGTIYTAADLIDWENNFGVPLALAAASSVPEPTTLTILSSLLLFGLFRRHGRPHNFS